ncbi:MAG: hypothetical protein ACRDNZ_10440, partial [Streptosporangiaceae bacterium]
AVVAAVPGGAAARPAVAAGTGHAQTAAFVLSKVAAAQVSSSSMISVDQQLGGGGSGTTYTDVATQQQRTVSSQRTSSGQPRFQIAWANSGGSTKETDVEYQHHVFSVSTASSFDAGQGQNATLSSFLPLQSNSDPAVAFREALNAGTVRVVGHQNLNGRDTILLRAKSQIRLAGVTIPDSWIWVDASTYMVVQTKWLVPHWQGQYKAGTKVTFSADVHQVSWLSPTPENLALLTATPPAGFTKISRAEMVQKYLGPIS